jgi:N-acetylmuramoyl-L-alanine amidase
MGMHSLKQWFKQMGIYRLLLLAIAVAALLYIFTYEELSDQSRSSWSVPLSGKIIVLDPGHGGMDGGAVSKSGLVEKDLSLAIAKYLRDFLQEAGALVIMTREDDRDLADEGAEIRKRQDLERRVELINSNSTDLMISIHLNSIPSPKWRGAQTFYNPNRKENAIVAHLIQQELITNLENTDRKAKMNQDIFLLKSINTIGALVEVGFLSNPEEANLLSDQEYQKKVADSIYRGILRYFAGEQVPGIE